MRRWRHNRIGQAATEYMLVVSVVVLATVGAGYAFVPKFRAGVRDLARDAKHMLASGDVARNAGRPPMDCGSGSACGRPRPDPFTPPRSCRAGERC